MSKFDGFENDLLVLIFENTNLANLGDATGLVKSTADGNVTIALHTADPTDAGTQSSSEAAYTSYARVTVGRGAANWTATAGTCDNDAAITFAQATGGSETETHFSVGNGVANEGLYSGTVTPNLAVSNGIQPQFNAGDCNISED